MMKVLNKIFGISNERNLTKQNETRIVKVKNELGEISFNVEYFRKWGNHASMWFTKINKINNYEKVIEIKKEIDAEFKSKNIIEYNVL